MISRLQNRAVIISDELNAYFVSIGNEQANSSLTGHAGITRASPRNSMFLRQTTEHTVSIYILDSEYLRFIVAINGLHRMYMKYIVCRDALFLDFLKSRESTVYNQEN